jgi:hypothetical protein
VRPPPLQAFALIESSLGRPLGEVFSSISERPIAAASLGQVYKAVLRDTGEEVAVKVGAACRLRTASACMPCMHGRTCLLVQSFDGVFRGTCWRRKSGPWWSGSGGQS